MKQIKILVVTMVFVLSISMLLNQTCMTHAETVPIQVVEIPDPNLKAVLKQGFKLADNEELTNYHLAALTRVDLSGLEIQDLTGLDYAINLVGLSLSNNNITSIEALRGLNKLEILLLDNNQITDLSPLENCSQLSGISAKNNQFATLKGLENKPNLVTVILQDNSQLETIEALRDSVKISSLNIQNTPKLCSLVGIENANDLKEIYAINSGLEDISQLPVHHYKSLFFSGCKIRDVSRMRDITCGNPMDFSENKIADISPLTLDQEKYPYRSSWHARQTVEVLAFIDPSKPFVFKNPLRGKLSTALSQDGKYIDQIGEEAALVEPSIDSIPYDGVYDKVTNTITWNKIPNNVTELKYEFYKSYEQGASGTQMTPFNGTVTIKVIRNTINAAPVITVSDKVLTVGDSFDPLNGVTAMDREDGDIVLTQDHIIYNDVDTTKVGDYRVTYKVTDQGGASITKSINVRVNPRQEVLNAAPVITVSDKVLTVGDSFDPLEGVTATDREDGNIVVSGSSIIYNDVDTTKVGDYRVTYKVIDQGGASTTKSINVRVNPRQEVLNAAPVITVSDKVLTVGDSFDPLDGVTATDREDGNIVVSGSSIIYNDVDTTKAGTYQVIYRVTDKNGASTTKGRIVYVKEKEMVIPNNSSSNIPFIPDEDKKEEVTVPKEEPKEEIADNDPVEPEEIEDEKDAVLNLKGQKTESIEEEKEHEKYTSDESKKQEGIQGQNGQDTSKVVMQQGMFLPKTNDTTQLAMYWFCFISALGLLLFGIRRKVKEM